MYHILPSIWNCWVKIFFKHSSRWIEVSYCDFHSHFPDDCDFGHLFIYLYCHLYNFPGKVAFWGVVFLLNYNSFYIQTLSPLFDMWFANIFSSSIACLVILNHGCFLVCLFAKLKHCNFDKSSLSVFSFCGLCLCGYI